MNSPTITRFRKLFLPADIGCCAFHEVFSLLFLFNYLFYGSIWYSYDQHHVHLLLLVMQCLLFVKMVLSFHVSPIWNILIWDLFFFKNCCMINMLSLWLKVALIFLSENHHKVILPFAKHKSSCIRNIKCTAQGQYM